jgi:hypothetical protein
MLNQQNDRWRAASEVAWQKKQEERRTSIDGKTIKKKGAV